MEVVVSRAACAIADRWHSGMLSVPGEALPHRREVHALVGRPLTAAIEEVRAARAKLRDVISTAASRTQASMAAGMRLPFSEIAREFGLSPVAAECLLLVAAPLLRGEVARLYGIVANDLGRPICDRHLVEQILGGGSATMRESVAAELADGAPLLRFGLITAAATPPDRYLFAPLMVDPVLIARLRGQSEGGVSSGTVTSLYGTTRRIDELCVPRSLLRDIVQAVAQEHREQPLRLLLHGRQSSGRRTLLAALAQRAGRQLAVISVERLIQVEASRFASLLRLEIQRAHLRGAVPCVSGLGSFDTQDGEQLREQVRDVFRTHPGPLVFRCDVNVTPPLDAGYVAFTIPSVSETTRRAFWRQTLVENCLSAAGVDHLAQRFRLSPGAIVSAARSVADAQHAPGDDATERLDQAARQHITTRMSRVADKVERLARWEQVCLPGDVIDSIREFIGRARHRQTVFEAWGFDPSTSRGLTALFFGAPGTGKTLVAGLVARELKLDLYRVDLSRVVSKWIGETEKNLAAVFDAAEDGHCLILFDEADSLFARRTEVKSSVDRYANLEVNYLLQRLDTFEGIAILTTNIEGSVDEAFKRRMSLRLSFPFPDEDTRFRLWAAHIPPQAPTQGDLDLRALAEAFPLSGGYIRNCSLRAAFLAAQEGVPLSHEHLLRAVRLEYLDMGKLDPSGRLH
jgi:hypothetical protein